MWLTWIYVQLQPPDAPFWGNIQRYTSQPPTSRQLGVQCLLQAPNVKNLKEIAGILSFEMTLCDTFSQAAILEA